jgi:hypothetical protein
VHGEQIFGRERGGLREGDEEASHTPADLGRVAHVPHKDASVSKSTYRPLAVGGEAHSNRIRPSSMRLLLLPGFTSSLECRRFWQRAHVLQRYGVKHPDKTVAARAGYETVRGRKRVD